MNQSIKNNPSQNIALSNLAENLGIEKLQAKISSLYGLKKLEDINLLTALLVNYLADNLELIQKPAQTENSSLFYLTCFPSLPVDFPESAEIPIYLYGDKTMTVRNVQCRPKATEETLRYLWNSMIEQNTLLVSEILEKIKTHPELNTWMTQGYIPGTAIDEIAKQLTQQNKYVGMPSRFSTSAKTLVKNMYKSWFAVQEKKDKSALGKKKMVDNNQKRTINSFSSLILYYCTFNN